MAKVKEAFDANSEIIGKFGSAVSTVFENLNYAIQAWVEYLGRVGAIVIPAFKSMIATLAGDAGGRDSGSVWVEIT